MPSLSVLRVLLRELTTGERSPRHPEPDLVMDDAKKVAAYTDAGRVSGVMAPVYLFHCAQICEVILPGDTVMDLACGPATQLAMVAGLNPETKFVGIDLSEEMLGKAQRHIDELGLNNVKLRHSDIANLDFITDRSIDAVYSTMALHHLPGVDLLRQTFAEVERILKDDGGLYVVDFAHLKSEKSIEYFAYQYADRQPELFTIDYLHSLRAAFNLNDFRDAALALERRYARVYSTFLAPYMVAVKSPPRNLSCAGTRKALREIRRALPKNHQTDFNDLKTFFRLGGLRSRLL